MSFVIVIDGGLNGVIGPHQEQAFLQEFLERKGWKKRRSKGSLEAEWYDYWELPKQVGGCEMIARIFPVLSLDDI